ncbi:hypothetical protein ACHAQH_008463 [Verticillium albo-atrum]
MAINYYQDDPSLAAAIIFIVGGGKLVNAETDDDRSAGEFIIIGGLVVQMLFFSLFIAVACTFHLKVKKGPEARDVRINTRWERLMIASYVASILILIRSLFRLIEYAMGHDPELQSKEVYIYILDGLPMLAATTLFNFIHPSHYLTTKKDSTDASNSEMKLTGRETSYRFEPCLHYAHLSD